MGIGSARQYSARSGHDAKPSRNITTKLMLTRPLRD
jgi:hypothetical protein